MRTPSRSFPSGLLLVLIIAAAGCTLLAKRTLDERFGPAAPRNRIVPGNTTSVDYTRDVKPILTKRCVVCHSCYDAPCQLQLGSIEGIDRGANKESVYDTERLLPAQSTMLYFDAHSTAQWRGKGFSPVLNERDQSPTANLEGSVLYRMLRLKHNAPPFPSGRLPDGFDVSLDRKQRCPAIEEMDQFEKELPLWGMPYGMPEIDSRDLATLTTWLSEGGVAAPEPEESAEEKLRISEWESFLNGATAREQLMSRYLFEHLFLAHLYFSDLTSANYFALVRSKTPPGRPIEILSSRRPYDDPGVHPFYYRLWRVRGPIVEKTHMPYALNDGRMGKWRGWFLDPQIAIDRVPSYDPVASANPFITFAAIPARVRFAFLVDEAQFTIANFIKGPVCRGNMALNVIEDRFWVMFLNPSSPFIDAEELFSASHYDVLRLPSEAGSTARVLADWLEYSRVEKGLLAAKEEFLRSEIGQNRNWQQDLIWDGDKVNKNATLTIFRHGDSASVVKGLVGPTPKTAWFIGYALLERIHYLLVAGYDVYGNVGHQLNSRLFMDFLRMEGEYNFLSLLPPDVRQKERDFWYRDAEDEVQEYISWQGSVLDKVTPFAYTTATPKEELFNRVRGALGKALSVQYEFSGATDEALAQLRALSEVPGEHAQFMPHVSLVRLTGKGRERVVTIIRDAGYSNVASPLHESSRRRPLEDSLLVVPGFLGAYPNAFFVLDESSAAAFVNEIRGLKTEADYAKLLDRYGVRRTNPRFWQLSDWFHEEYKKFDPEGAGLFDYNRFEDR